ncbi:MAG: hypothetical protein ACOCP8_00900 [archaeon]
MKIGITYNEIENLRVTYEEMENFTWEELEKMSLDEFIGKLTMIRLSGGGR